MLLNILQYTDSPYTPRNYPALRGPQHEAWRRMERMRGQDIPSSRQHLLVNRKEKPKGENASKFLLARAAEEERGGKFHHTEMWVERGSWLARFSALHLPHTPGHQKGTPFILCNRAHPTLGKYLCSGKRCLTPALTFVDEKSCH